MLFRKREEIRLGSIRSTIDCHSPKQFKHMKTNFKKRQLDHDRKLQIDDENRLLVTKLSQIMKDGTSIPSVAEPNDRIGTHAMLRMRERARIKEDNKVCGVVPFVVMSVSRRRC